MTPWPPAGAKGQTLIAGNSHLPPITTSAARDAWCAAHHDDP